MQVIRRIQLIKCIAIILIVLGLILLMPINKIMITFINPLLAIMLICFGALLFFLMHIEMRGMKSIPKKLTYFDNQTKQLKQNASIIEKNDPTISLPRYDQFKEMIELTIEHAKQHQEQFCMIYIDINKLEAINEEFGRSIGDGLLMQLSERLNESFRKKNFSTRIGDDEFCLIITDIKSFAHLDRTVKRLTNLLNMPYHINEHEVYSSVTTGIACFPRDGATFEELVFGAKAALSDAKKECRGGYRYLTSDIHQEHNRRIHLESELRIAIENNQLELYYQPQFSLKEKNLVGLECLARWNNPVLGSISPVEFIPLAESMGLLYKITDWVILTSVMQLNRWHAIGLTGFQLAINLSADKFQNSRFLPNFLEKISELGIKPSNIEFEITEVIVNRLIESGKNNIDDIADSGIKIAIDDFGTGYSSLNRLISLPITTLKIDKSFIHDFDKKNKKNKQIIEMIISLARNLNIDVLAEGIETEKQLQFLIEKDCKFGQGYLYSKPLNAENTTQFLKNRLKKRGAE